MRDNSNKTKMNTALPYITKWNPTLYDNFKVLIAGYPMGHVVVFDNNFDCIALHEIDVGNMRGVTSSANNVPIIGRLALTSDTNRLVLQRISEEDRDASVRWLENYCIPFGESIVINPEYIKYDPDFMSIDIEDIEEDEYRIEITEEMNDGDFIFFESFIKRVHENNEDRMAIDQEEMPDLALNETEIVEDLQELRDMDLEPAEGADDKYASQLDQMKEHDAQIEEGDVFSEAGVGIGLSGSTVEAGMSDEHLDENSGKLDIVEEVAQEEDPDDLEEENRNSIERLYQYLIEHEAMEIASQELEEEPPPPADDFLQRQAVLMRSSDWEPKITIGKPHLIIPNGLVENNSIVHNANCSVRSVVVEASLIVAFENENGEPHKIWESQIVNQGGLVELLSKGKLPVAGTVAVMPIEKQAGEITWDIEPLPPVWRKAVSAWLEEHCQMETTDDLQVNYILSINE